jgi:hypothetical protein
LSHVGILEPWATTGGQLLFILCLLILELAGGGVWAVRRWEREQGLWQVFSNLVFELGEGVQGVHGLAQLQFHRGQGGAHASYFHAILALGL